VATLRRQYLFVILYALRLAKNCTNKITSCTIRHLTTELMPVTSK